MLRNLQRLHVLTSLLLSLACLSFSASDTNNHLVLNGTGNTVGFGELKEEWRGEVIHLSWSPRLFLIKKFLTDEECDHLINTAKPMMTNSSVVDSSTGKSVPSKVRTSTGTFFSKGQDEIIGRIEKRVAQVTMIPQENQEGLQILNYQNGQEYGPHYDYFHDSVNSDASHGGQRVVTMLIYLSTVEEGGETLFPNAEKKVSGEGWSDCALKGFAVKPFKGDAVMFYSLKPDGSTDPSSMHGSCPTLKGSKWSATKWIHVAPVTPAPKVKAKDGCHDEHDQCTEWAYFGECEKNPVFMDASCKKSCKKCSTQ